MRKRLALLWTPFVIAMALMFPATTVAGNSGSISVTNEYCVGATIYATFKVVKYSGYYATDITMSAKGQGWHGGRWVNEYNIGTWQKNVFTSARATMSREFWYDANHAGDHRIKVVGKIWDGSYLVGKGSERSGYC